MEYIKEFIKLNIIPIIMIVITIITFVAKESIRKVLLAIQIVLLAIHMIRCINYINKQKRGE